jgi:SSS family solute:Na+ symporter
MFTHDIVRHYGFHDKLSERQQVLFGRVFVMLLLAAAFLLSLITTRSIFNMGVWSLTGYSGLFPLVLAALFWKRSTKQGVMAGIVTVAALWTFFFFQSLGVGGDFSVGGTGVLPVVAVVFGASLVVVVVSLSTRPPSESVIEKFFSE